MPGKLGTSASFSGTKAAKISRCTNAIIAFHFLHCQLEIKIRKIRNLNGKEVLNIF